MDIEKWLAHVLRGIDVHDGSEFAGLGLVFYTDKKSLPVHPLTNNGSLLSLPTSTMGDAIDLLSKISRQSSSYHDGFHLIDARLLSITDVSQFIAPPIPPTRLPISGVCGARTMAARLASLLSGVKATAVYAASQEAMIFQRGELKRIQIPHHSRWLNRKIPEPREQT